jgi:hypothetical protein
LNITASPNKLTEEFSFSLGISHHNEWLFIEGYSVSFIMKILLLWSLQRIKTQAKFSIAFLLAALRSMRLAKSK